MTRIRIREHTTVQKVEPDEHKTLEHTVLAVKVPTVLRSEQAIGREVNYVPN